MLLQSVCTLVRRISTVDQLPKISRPNNFDFLRFALAFSVVLVHFPFSLPSISAFFTPLSLTFYSLGAVASFAVRCFFVISGFLIVMSYENSKSLKTYALNRIRRIYPAYFFIILAAAFGLFFVSSLSWQEYFSHPDFFRYIFYNLVFLNTTQSSLPGVFDHLNDRTVNGALWTIKIEIMFYVAVPVLVFLFRRFNKLLLISSIYILSYCYFLGCAYIAQKTGSSTWEQLSRQLIGQLSFFMSGALLYYYFDRFRKYAHALVVFAIALVVIQMRLPEADFLRPTANLADPVNLVANFLLPISLGIIIMFIAFCVPYLHVFIKYGDLSYGIYIFHFPIVRTFADLGLYKDYSILMIGLTISVVLLAAFCSWHLLEKPFLSRNNYYKLTSH